MSAIALEKWHQVVEHKDGKLLNELLADDVVFYSPVVHTPQVGRDITLLYLQGALHVLLNDSFTYLREIVSEHDAVLEFETEIDGLIVNGVDMIKWNDEGELVEFKVMLRPLKAVNLIHQKMGEMLQLLQK